LASSVLWGRRFVLKLEDDVDSPSLTCMAMESLLSDMDTSASEMSSVGITEARLEFTTACSNTFKGQISLSTMLLRNRRSNLTKLALVFSGMKKVNDIDSFSALIQEGRLPNLGALELGISHESGNGGMPELYFRAENVGLLLRALEQSCPSLLELGFNIAGDPIDFNLFSLRPESVPVLTTVQKVALSGDFVWGANVVSYVFAQGARELFPNFSEFAAEGPWALMDDAGDEDPTEVDFIESATFLARAGCVIRKFHYDAWCQDIEPLPAYFEDVTRNGVELGRALVDSVSFQIRHACDQNGADR